MSGPVERAPADPVRRKQGRVVGIAAGVGLLVAVLYAVAMIRL